jgi:hypothetical protein
MSGSLGFELTQVENTPAGNVDLYGLGRRSAATVLITDYWANTSAVDITDATFLQGNLLTPASSPTNYTSSDISSYLNAQYAEGTGVGQYVFLRLSTDAAFSNNQRYFVSTAEGGQGDESIWPQINYQHLGLALLPDDDDDGLPDQWEMQYLNTLASTADEDSDDDGQSDGVEYIVGTNPDDPNSWFHAKSITPNGSSGFTVKWDSVAARTYTVLQSGTLDGVWTAASTPMAGTGGELSFTGTTAGATTRFFKIQVTLP